MERERKLHSGKDILTQLTGNDLDENLTTKATREEVFEIFHSFINAFVELNKEFNTCICW